MNMLKRHLFALGFLAIACFSFVFPLEANAGTCRFRCFQTVGPLPDISSGQPPARSEVTRQGGFTPTRPVSCNTNADCTNADACNTYCRELDSRSYCVPSEPGVCEGATQTTNPTTEKVCKFDCRDRTDSSSQPCGDIATCNLSASDITCNALTDCTLEACNAFCGRTNRDMVCATASVQTAARCEPRNVAAAQQATQQQAAGRASPTSLSNPLSTTDFRVIFGRVARAFIGIVGAFALLMYVLGGILWMTAGDSKRVDMAKSMLINSTIGILLIFFAYFISVAFLAVFGINV